MQLGQVGRGRRQPAEVDLEAGRFTDHTDETLSALAEELKREARAARRGVWLASPAKS